MAIPTSLFIIFCAHSFPFFFFVIPFFFFFNVALDMEDY